tara:strand:+ start:149 stop:358 length:210 start_codon:yes stop_codon:yes gene_type:complete
MENLQVMFDSLIGYLVGMTLTETIVKPLLVRNGQKLIREVDRDASVPDWVVPDFLYAELEEQREPENDD